MLFNFFMLLNAALIAVFAYKWNVLGFRNAIDWSAGFVWNVVFALPRVASWIVADFCRMLVAGDGRKPTL